MRTTTKAPLLGFFALAFLTACGGGSSSSGGSGSCPNIAGTWNSTEIVDASDCGSSGTDTEHQTYTIAQNGCAITATVSGATFTGTVSETHASWTGSFPDSGGTTTVTGMNLTLSSDQNTVTGTASWTWTGSGSSCTGTTQITATRQ